MLKLGLPEASGDRESIDRGSFGDVPDNGLGVYAADLGRNVTVRAEVEDG